MFGRGFKIGYIFILFALLTASTSSARSVREQKSIGSDGAQRIEVEFNFSAGELRMNTFESDMVADLDILYDDRRCEVMIEYEVHGKTGELFLESDYKRKTDLYTEDNKWVVDLSTRYPMTIAMDVGACDANLELGGLQLERFKFDVGAASCDLSFSKPNPVRMEQFKVEAGACSIDMTDIGNANFESFDLEGGVGSFDLDFRGTYTGESQIDIEIGLGSADITLPSGVPVRVEIDRAPFLSSVEFHRGDIEEIEDDIYESDDFEDADIRIILKVEVGLGSVDITWRR